MMSRASRLPRPALSSPVTSSWLLAGVRAPEIASADTLKNAGTTEINQALKDDPSLANSDPLGTGWFFKIKLSDASQIDALMDETTDLPAPSLRRRTA